MHALTRIRQIQSDMAALSNALRPQVFGSHLATATRTLDQAVGVSSGGFGTGDSPVAFGDLPLRQFPRWNPRMDSLGAPTSPLSIPEEVSLPTRADRWLGEIEAAANRHGVSPTLLTALVWSESAFNPDAVSSAGAIGLAQLMPGGHERRPSRPGAEPRRRSPIPRGPARPLRFRGARPGRLQRRTGSCRPVGRHTEHPRDPELRPDRDAPVPAARR